MDKRIELYKKNLKEKKFLLQEYNENLEYINQGFQGEVFVIKKLDIIVKKLSYIDHQKWIPVLNRKNIYNDPTIGNEIKTNEKITKYIIKNNIPFYPLFYGFKIFFDKDDIIKSSVHLYFENIKKSVQLGTKFNQIKKKKIVENIFLRIMIGLYILNKKINITHRDLHLKNVLIQKKKKTKKYDIFNIDDKVIYVPDIGYNVFLIDFGISKFIQNNNNIEDCYFFKYHRFRYIILELCKKNKKDLEKIISNNNIKNIKNSKKYFPKKLVYCTGDDSIYQRKLNTLIYLIIVHVVKYDTNLKEINTILPNNYIKIYKKLEKTFKVCSKDILKWIFINFPTFFKKPSKINVLETYNI